MEQWPHEVHTETDDRVVFYPIIATIDRVFDNQYGRTYIFKEDPTKRRTKEGKEYRGQLWKVHPNSTDPTYEKGHRVKVRLEIKRGPKGGIYYNVDKIGPPENLPAHADVPAREAKMPPPQAIGPGDQIPAEFTLPLDYYREKSRTERASFERQGVLNRQTEVIVALPELMKAKVIDLEAAQALFADWQSRASYLWNRHGTWDAVGDVEGPEEEEKSPEAVEEPADGDTFQSDGQPGGSDADGDGGEGDRDQEPVTDPADLPWNPDED